MEAFLSEIGEPQPWKNFDGASQTQEFFLEAGQEIKIDVPFNTSDLTGDQQLSFWVFTRHDLPFSPQNGGWYQQHKFVLMIRDSEFIQSMESRFRTYSKTRIS